MTKMIPAAFAASCMAASSAGAATITFSASTTPDDAPFDSLTESFTTGGATFTATGFDGPDAATGTATAQELGVSNLGLGIVPDVGGIPADGPEISAIGSGSGNLDQRLTFSVGGGLTFTEVILGSVGNIAAGSVSTGSGSFTFDASTPRDDNGTPGDANDDTLMFDLTPFAASSFEIDTTAGDITLLSATAVPSPTALAGGLALSGVFALKRRRPAAAV